MTVPSPQTALASAFLALSPQPTYLSEGLAALHAQTVSAAVDVQATDVLDFLLAAGEWGGLMNAISPGSTAPSGIQAICRSLKEAVDRGRPFRTSVSAVSKAVSGWLGALQAAGLLTSGTAQAFQGMTVAVQPVWPGIVLDSLQACQRAGMLPGPSALPPYPGYHPG